MTHELKTDVSYFALVMAGTKRFELRIDDRGFRVGDTLHLREYDWKHAYTGREVTVRVTQLLRGHVGLAPGYVCMSIEVL